MSTDAPLGPVGDGDRDALGRFRPGNRAACGNPLGGKVQALRVALVQAVDEDDVAKIAAGLIEQAIAGDVQAAKIILDRVLGPSQALDLMARLETIEQRLEDAEAA